MELLPLNKSDIQQIHNYSCKLLSETGIDIDVKEIADALIKAGAHKGKGTNRICIPELIIRNALSKCPSEFYAWSVDGKKTLIGGNSRDYSTCLVDPGMNTDNGENRPPLLEDCGRNARIVDSLSLVAMPYKMDLAYEGLTTLQSVAKSNEQYFANSTKHVICGPCNKNDAEIWMEMAEIMAPVSVRETPIVSVLISPSSPLGLHQDCLEMLQIVLKYGAPVICLPCPMCGLTSPLSVAGTIVQLNAENLALITIIQLLRSGHPVIYHTVGMAADMVSATARLSSPEKLLIGLATAQMGRFYNIPSSTAGSSTDVSTFDIQNGAESMSQILSAVLGQANLITGIGSNSNACGTSAEQILMDCEMVRLAEHYRKGIQMEDLDEAIESITRVHPGGEFLTDEHTVTKCRSEEFFTPDLFDWTGFPGEGKGLYGKAKERVQQILSEHVPNVPEDRLLKLHKYVEEIFEGVLV